MEKGSFSDYLFAKMSSDTNNGIAGPADCTVESGAPRELTRTRKWIAENMLLLVTLCGVVLGIVVGEFGFCCPFAPVTPPLWCFGRVNC